MPSAIRSDATFRLEYSVTTSIAAPAERVWGLLTDAASWPSWTTTVSRLDGDIAVGSKLALRVPISERTFTPRVARLDPNRRMVWSDGMAPMFKGERTYTLAQWKAATGLEANSFVGTRGGLFVAPDSGNFRLGPLSRAINAGTATGAPPTDLEGNPRPSGGGVDVGAYERSTTPATSFVSFSQAAYSAVVRKNRHGFAQSADDHLTLSRIYLDRGKYPQALDTLAQTKKAFAASTAVQARAATVESLVHVRADNPRDARKALDEALAAANAEGVSMSPEAALELARACHLNRREHEATELVQRLVSNNHDDQRLLDAVRALYRELEREEQGEHLIERCVADAVGINNEGVARAKAGDLDGAIELLEEAARTMPDNAHIVLNAAHALISHMRLHGLQADKRARVEAYMRRAHERNPGHPKYAQVDALYRDLMQAYQHAA